MKALSAAFLTRHLRALAGASVRIEWLAQGEGTASRRKRLVRLPRLTERTAERRYALGLHELGHVLGRHPATRLEKEVAAWEWARVSALVWTREMTAERTRCLRSYLVWAQEAQDRRNARPRLPPPGAALWVLLGEGEAPETARRQA